MANLPRIEAAAIIEPTTGLVKLRVVTGRGQAVLESGDMIGKLVVSTRGQGLTDITGQVAEVVRASGIEEGLATVFVQHTSASLVIQENADPSVRRDLESFLNRLVPEDASLYTHTAEGPDDMPSHVKSALTQTSLAVPVVAGRLGLGTWQGIYLWEHRRRGSQRSILVHVGS
jgi:secondary thiamine-phosphate synthase enzyme